MESHNGFTGTLTNVVANYSQAEKKHCNIIKQSLIRLIIDYPRPVVRNTNHTNLWKGEEYGGIQRYMSKVRLDASYARTN